MHEGIVSVVRTYNPTKVLIVCFLFGSSVQLLLLLEDPLRSTSSSSILLSLILAANAIAAFGLSIKVIGKLSSLCSSSGSRLRASPHLRLGRWHLLLPRFLFHTETQVES
ncbi:hypothetical protein NE237_025055 [Protea cynaroides]|uniref:Uncharacterized protein n=1 Tax=Protea cynaroides TaxID=273540 RepID=A0A9Q0H2D6_9MAGN|nr:hypothetical protein NE237_025055 [Protea cynaroides]